MLNETGLAIRHELERLRKVGRPSTAAPLGPQIVQWLSTDPRLSGAELLRRAREFGYHGGKSALYDLVRRLRRPSPGAGRQLGVMPGVISRHDFARVDLAPNGGQPRRLYFLASRLEWSRFIDVRIADDSSESALVRCLLQSFETFGGIPLVAVWSHARLVASSCEGQLVNWNPLFAQFALDYHFVPELDPLRPRRAGPDGHQGLARWVKDSFFRRHRFGDQGEVQGALPAWLGEMNRQRPHGSAVEAPAVRLEEERSRLRPLPFAPSEYAVRLRVAAPRI